MPSVAVVGGGIAGLTAAWDLARAGWAVTVLEADDRLGGKVRTEPFAGVDLDLGPDAFLARRPEAIDLCAELGLDDQLVAPATTAASVWSRGRLRRLPEGLVLGVPADAIALARSRVLSPLGTARAAIEPLLPGRPLSADEDVAVGALARRRLGTEAASRLVDPLLGGINAGDTDRLSVDAVAPQLAAAARRSRSLVRGVRATGGSAGAGPVFLTLPGGLGRLVDVLAAGLANLGVDVRTGAPVHDLTPLDADGVVLAVPAHAAAPLLRPLVPEAAAGLADIEHASVALVALAYPSEALPPLPGSGFLVPRTEGRLMTACSWSSSKWPHLAAPGQTILRLSAGRAGDGRAPAMDDDDLVARLGTELRAAMGVTAAPTAVRVARWPNGFPQYAPGHLDRMAAVRTLLDERLPGVALAGAALGGVGLPACIASGRAAARRLRAKALSMHQ